MTDLEFWFYVSVSEIDPAQSDATVADIVEVSVPRNLSLDVTGALIATGRRFAQYLEGPPVSIAALRASIMADPRHSDVWTVYQGATETRQFNEWSLAYAGTTPYFDHLVHLSRELRPSSARILLTEMIQRFATAR